VRPGRAEEIDLSPSEDTVFALLYPGAADAADAANAANFGDAAAALSTLAAEWARHSPLEIAGRLAAYESAAQEAGRRGRRRLSAFCRALAAAVERPEAWLDAFLAQGFYDRALPFLEEDVARRREGWERRLLSALAVDPLAEAAAALALRLPDPPPDLFERALEETARTPLLAETLAREGVPLPALRQLLAARRWQTALAAALGEWMAPPSGEVRPELAGDWTAAVLRARTAEYEETAETLSLQYGLRLLLARDPDLALAWLEARLADSDLPVYFAADSAFARAIEALDRPRRERLLRPLRQAPLLQSLLPHLVGGDAGLFRQLLAAPALVAYHLAPLRRAPDAVWVDFATAALDAAHAPREVAEASLFRPTDPGAPEDRWQQRDRAFAALAESPRADLREVGRLGRQRVQEEVRRERDRAALPRSKP
jgi:hypothetical protein